ncbi:Axonemal dynein light chain domain-containing protein [Rozella allomycis CSF55]|uniref:Axonemal dynein light chain domain-containing protein n=1 Tax=Rozella allomycis (strain CSF55) TaxID=988480 RepID=A0A075B1K8_ROZAC|nr:Axonemal dynein light chain domain-containing protein [Rozella allomycis CSF55]|eukprot:EPZ36471.1 Axonemal dynein light chain domain-containing protein [Rozella allomycis CSF55]
MLHIGQSLIKYDNPVLVSKATDNSKLPQKQTEPKKSQLPPSSPTKDEKLKNLQQPTATTEDILNSILPPKEWDENGQFWVQQVSSTPATRLDVINLQRQARETGICPIRRELYSQCFDELIRQVTITCQERGLLLLRVRDEIRMTLAAYQTLYESSVAFGMRKALQAEQGKSEMESQLKQLEEEKKNLEHSVSELKAKCEAIEKRENERRAMDERKHAEEIAFLKKTNLQLKTQLEVQSHMSGTQSNISETGTLLGLPAPSDVDNNHEVGSNIRLDALGPLVINEDGSMSRITNWDNMTESEKTNTMRVLGRRNKERLNNLKVEGKSEVGR